MRIRSCGPADLPVLLEIFYQSVHLACTGEYTPAQLDAWAPAEPDFASWGDSLRREIFLTAEEHGSLLGFAAWDCLCIVRRAGTPLPGNTHLCPRLQDRQPLL